MTKKLSKSSGAMSKRTAAGLGKAVSVISKIIEIAHWVGAVGMIIISLFGFTNGAILGDAFKGNIPEASEIASTYGLQMENVVADGSINYPAIACFGVAGIFSMVLMAMVFRNVHLIAKKSIDQTPFQADNVRMLKEIGIFLIAVPVIGLIFATIASAITDVEASVNAYTLVTGLIMLYLTQLFARGVELEEEVEGLI